ncbi:hypothetical protein [Peribacillus deserti]|nr:hypothetical protein [Peribacillus deserti]
MYILNIDQSNGGFWKASLSAFLGVQLRTAILDHKPISPWKE